MKVPLRFQLTEFDCGSVSLLNAISYLFEREEIPAQLVRAISIYSLDCYDENGNLGQGGTSREAVNLLSKWMNNYANERNLGIKCKHLLKEEVNLDSIRDNIENNGVACLRTYLSGEHYVIITKIDEENVYMFDPYYLDENYYDKERMVEIIFDMPFKYNRKVSIKRFISEDKKDFSLGPINDRECLIIQKVC